MRHKSLRFGKGFRVAFAVRKMQAAEMVLAPGDSEGDADNRHRGADQWLYVVSGKLGLEIGGEQSVLEPGDAAHFSAENPHRLTALGGQDAEIILVACAVPYLLLKSYL